MLVAILEGGKPTLEYLKQNNIIPDTVFYDFSEFEEYSMYFPEDTDILVLIKGMTDYTRVKIYDLLDVLNALENKNTLTIATNVDLGKLAVDSYFYFDDPIEGAFVQVPAGKTYKEVAGKRKRGLLTGFIGYNPVDTEIVEYGEQYEREYSTDRNENDEFIDKIFNINLFN